MLPRQQGWVLIDSRGAPGGWRPLAGYCGYLAGSIPSLRAACCEQRTHSLSFAEAHHSHRLDLPRFQQFLLRRHQARRGHLEKAYAGLSSERVLQGTPR